MNQTRLELLLALRDRRPEIKRLASLPDRTLAEDRRLRRIVAEARQLERVLELLRARARDSERRGQLDLLLPAARPLLLKVVEKHRYN
jgi:hypothetical protein